MFDKQGGNKPTMPGESMKDMQMGKDETGNKKEVGELYGCCIYECNDDMVNPDNVPDDEVRVSKNQDFESKLKDIMNQLLKKNKMDDGGNKVIGEEDDSKGLDNYVQVVIQKKKAGMAKGE